MYSRKTGTLYNEAETQRKIDSFNKDLREQYRLHNTPTKKEETNETKSSANIDINNPEINESIILIGLILLMLGEENKDYLLIGALAILLFLNR